MISLLIVISPALVKMTGMRLIPTASTPSSKSSNAPTITSGSFTVCPTTWSTTPSVPGSQPRACKERDIPSLVELGSMTNANDVVSPPVSVVGVPGVRVWLVALVIICQDKLIDPSDILYCNNYRVWYRRQAAISQQRTQPRPVVPSHPGAGSSRWTRPGSSFVSGPSIRIQLVHNFCRSLLSLAYRPLR